MKTNLKDSPTLEDLLTPGFSAEDSREIFLDTFPELEHISDASSLEERRIACAKLRKRLGIRPIPGGPLV